MALILVRMNSRLFKLFKDYSIRSAYEKVMASGNSEKKSEKIKKETTRLAP